MTRDHLFNVSQSKVNAWRRCRLQFHFQHVDHLKPFLKARPLKFGGIVHTLMEELSKGKDPFKKLQAIGEHERKLFREEIEYYGDIITDIEYIMRAYIKFWAKEPLKWINVNGKKAELPFEVELTSEIRFKGTLDGVVKHRSFTALLEHKTHKNIPNDDHRWRNLQSAVYIRMLQMAGWVKDIDGTLWNYVRSKSPTRPKLLKAGGMSQASIDTLPDVIGTFLTEHKLSAVPYKEFISTQIVNLQTWFQRVYTPIKPEVVMTLFLEFVRTAREMAGYYEKNKSPPPRSIGQHCMWCSFEPLCRAELMGDDVDFVREHQFVVDDSEYQREGEYDEET
jgi:PD-(D/E)XK nuclease superfamily